MKTQMQKLKLLVVTFGCILSFTCSSAQSTEQMLQEFTQSYRTDPMALTATFGIRVGDEWWHVISERHEEGYPVGKSKKYTFHNYGPHEVELIKGKPLAPTWFFNFASAEVLEDIYSHNVTASTAAAKSYGTDQVGLDIDPMEGHEHTLEDDAVSYLVLEHFWKRETIEITRFSRDTSLPSHGAALVSLYTMKDKRIGWFSLGTGEGANTDEALQEGQVPNLMIFTKGRGKALLGEQEFEIEPGMSVFIPPYVKHVIYNPYDEPLEGILVLYGDNIDFALGQSYMSFLEAEYSFYEENRQERKEKP